MPLLDEPIEVSDLPTNLTGDDIVHKRQAVEPIIDDPKSQDDATAKAAAEAKAAADQAAEKERAAKEQQDKDAKKADLSVNPNLDDPEPVVKKDEKKDTITEEMPEDLAKGMTKDAAAKARESWKSIKTAEKQAVADRDAAKVELETIRKQLEDGGKSTAKLAELERANEQLKMELDGYRSEIAVTRIEATPEFKREVTGPMNTADTLARELATKYQVSPAAILDALHEPDTGKRTDALDDLIADFKRPDQIALVQAADAYARASGRAEEFRKDSGTKLEQMQRQATLDADKVNAQIAGEYRSSVDEAWKAVEDLHPILRKSTGGDERAAKWNEHLNGIRQEIDAVDINNLPTVDVAAAMVSHKVLPDIVQAKNHYEKQFKAERAARIAAEGKLKAFKKVEPGAGAGDHVTQPTTTNGTGKRPSFSDTMFPDGGERE